MKFNRNSNRFLKSLGFFVFFLYSLVWAATQSEKEEFVKHVVEDNIIHLTIDVFYNNSTKSHAMSELKKILQNKNIVTTIMRIHATIRGRKEREMFTNPQSQEIYHTVEVYNFIIYLQKEGLKNKVSLDKVVFDSFPDIVLKKVDWLTKVKNTMSQACYFIVGKPVLLYPIREIGFCGMENIYLIQYFLKCISIKYMGVLRFSNMKHMSFSALDINHKGPANLKQFSEVHCKDIEVLVLNMYNVEPNGQMCLNLSISTKMFNVESISTLLFNVMAVDSFHQSYKQYLQDTNNLKKEPLFQLFDMSKVDELRVIYSPLIPKGAYTSKAFAINNTLLYLRKTGMLLGLLTATKAPKKVYFFIQNLEVPLIEVFDIHKIYYSLDSYSENEQLHKNLKVFTTTDVLKKTDLKQCNELDLFFIQNFKQHPLLGKFIVIIPFANLFKLTTSKSLSELSNQWPECPFVEFLQSYAQKDSSSLVCSACRQTIDKPFTEFSEKPCVGLSSEESCAGPSSEEPCAGPSSEESCVGPSSEEYSDTNTLLVLPCKHALHTCCFKSQIETHGFYKHCNKIYTQHQVFMGIYQDSEVDMIVNSKRHGYSFVSKENPIANAPNIKENGSIMVMAISGTTIENIDENSCASSRALHEPLEPLQENFLQSFNRQTSSPTPTMTSL
ncbi:hypothetical protein NECID01_0996 [Nematocida sp. AWRm77]|nr:hypothetical protein NECID01_0996 [Nematocida sp. AWRm77]